MRMRVIDPDVIRHFIRHPARKTPWTLRDLADTLGCSPATLSHISSGTRATVPRELAERFSEAVGVETETLFVAVVSKKSATTRRDAATDVAS